MYVRSLKSSKSWSDSHCEHVKHSPMKQFIQIIVINNQSIKVLENTQGFEDNNYKLNQII